MVDKTKKKYNNESHL